MPVIRIDCEQIRDWPSFHDVFARELGFPAFYGRNMDAWIDCMTSLGDPQDGLTSIHCTPPGVVTLVLDHADKLPREIYATMLGCAAFVNGRRVEAGELAVLAVAATAPNETINVCNGPARLQHPLRPLVVKTARNPPCTSLSPAPPEPSAA